MTQLLIFVLFVFTCCLDLSAAQPRIVFHELVNPGPGKRICNLDRPAMSGDGQTVLYNVDRGDGMLDMFAINTDGTGQRTLGVFPTSSYMPAISHNGTMAALRVNFDLYSLNTVNGTPQKVLTMSGPGSIASATVNDDGTKIYFAIALDDTIAGTGTVLSAGVWEMNPDGSGRRLVTGLNAIRGTLGLAATGFERVGAENSLAISQNGRLVFTFRPNYGTSMAHVMGVHTDGTGLHVIGPQVYLPYSAGISRDGSRVVFDQYSPRDVHTAAWDGSGHVVQTVPGHGYESLRLTANGSHLALVDRILRADGGTFRIFRAANGSLLAEGSEHAHLSSDGRRMAAVRGYFDRSVLVSIELDPDTLRGAPDVRETSISPAFAVHANATQTTATARVTWSGTPYNGTLGTRSMRHGEPDPNDYPQNLLDNGTQGDAAAGDGLFTNNQLGFYYTTTDFGPRVMRFAAENTVNGLRHATLVDHEPFFVLATAPAGSAPVITAITPNPGTAGGVITITGSNFGSTRTGNVVTLNSHSVYALTANAAGTQITAEVPAWFGDGDYQVVVAANGQSSAPYAWRIGAAPLVPDINVTPGTLAFGTVNVGQSADLTLTIQNTGTASLNVPALNFSSARYTAPVVTLPLNIAAGASQQITVRFTPTAAGAANGTLNVISSDPDETSVAVNLTGTGQMTGGGTPDINITPQFGLDFGDVAVGQTKDLAFTVQNTGTGDLTVTAMTLSPAPSSQWFSRVSPSLPFTVAAGGSTQVTVRCAPDGVRIEIGDFDLTSNDPDESPKNVEMAAKGIAPVTPPAATAGISDSFGRANAATCNLGRADLAFGGSGNHYYLPVFPSGGANLTGGRLVNAGLDYGGVMFSATGQCLGAGENVGREYNISVRLTVPTDGAQRVTQAGPFFHGRAGVAYDGVIGGQNAGYWVALHSTGEVKVKNLFSTEIIAVSGVPAYFDPAAAHQLEIAVQETSLQVALDGRHLWFTQTFGQSTQQVPVITADATGGADNGTVGLVFGSEPNRGQIGGQTADNLVVGPYRSLLGLPSVDNSQPPPAATLSDTFARADAGQNALGQANHALGGSGGHYYIPVFSTGAVLSAGSLHNPGLDYSGVQFTATPGGSGENLGSSFNFSVKLKVPSGPNGAVTEAGPYFGNRSAAAGDGILGGQSAGYWVRLHSNGEVTVKNCHSTQIAGSIAASNGAPSGFDSSAWHRLEIAHNNGSLQVALNGRLLTFDQGGQQVTTLTLPATGGSPNGGTGIAFSAEQNRGTAGGQRADDIVLTAWRSLGSLPKQNNFTSPAPLTLTCPVPNRLKVAWPQAGYDGYLLEVSENPSAGWTPLLLPPASDGGQNSIEFDMQAAGFFYRLVKP